MAYEFSSNQVFVKVNNEDAENGKNSPFFEKCGKDNDYNIVQLVTSYKTSKEDIERFIENI